VFVMLFNNVYSTNFAQWIEGSWSSRVRLWVPDGAESGDEGLIGNSWEARAGCLAAVADAEPGKLPPTAAGLTIAEQGGDVRPPGAQSPQRRGLLVTAFGPNPDGEGTLLRLWEQAGEGGTYTLRFPQGLKVRAAQPCDLRGQTNGSPLAVSEAGTLDVTIKSLAPLSLILSDRGGR
jgi:alpha-mannosidase